MKIKKLNAVSFKNSTITGGFWKERQDIFRKTTIDAVYKRFEETGRFEALKFNWKEGMPFKPHIFWESDDTKWIEGAAFFLQKQRDAELEIKIDELISWMAKTQDKNGYLNAYFTVVEPEARFTRRMDHELYCAGHLIEAAIAYAEATGKKEMLQIAIRYADLIDRIFRIEHSAAFDTPGHEEIELALVKLYYYTGEKRYLDLAKYFIDTRGNSKKDITYEFADMEYVQSHLPVRDQTTAVGHSVRALYLYAAMADLAMETEDEELLSACKALYANITKKRMYITGGVGSTYRGEAFTFDYDLPEYTAYSETCASIALAMFCRRMWQMDVDGKYSDCAEQAIYNTVLGGVSLSGDRFFYENPLSVDPRRNAFNEFRTEEMKEHLPILERVKVFECSCCPPNLLRIVGSIADYMYSTDEETIYTHCYMEADTELEVNGQKVILEQRTQYPYDGNICINIRSDGVFGIALRIPGWCKKAKVYVNQKERKLELHKGYVYLKENWKSGDEIALKLPMEIKTYRANPQVVSACGRVAVMRGPIVYCAEGLDNEDKPLKDICLLQEKEAQLVEVNIANLKMPGICMPAIYTMNFEELYCDGEVEKKEMVLNMIPYFAWANRGISEMTTWFLK